MRANKVDDFLKRIEIDEATQCWSWTGPLNKTGYAIGSFEGKTRLLHRIVYQAFMGNLVGSNPLDHTCCNRRCLNPNHLEQVTPTENTRRGNAAKLSASEVDEIRNSYAGKDATQQELADEFGVSLQTINGIVLGKTWTEGMDTSTVQESYRDRLVENATKLSDEQVLIIRQRFMEGGITKTQLGNEYGIHPSHIGRIINHKVRVS